MTHEYETIIDAGAESILGVMRSGMWAPIVYAVPAPDKGPGRIGACTTQEGVPPGAHIIRPSDNGASLHESWRTVPFSHVRHTLWHACRREPVLSRAAA